MNLISRENISCPGYFQPSKQLLDLTQQCRCMVRWGQPCPGLTHPGLPVRLEQDPGLSFSLPPKRSVHTGGAGPSTSPSFLPLPTMTVLDSI